MIASTSSTTINKAMMLMIEVAATRLNPARSSRSAMGSRK
jgi:hypothetical protein